MQTSTTADEEMLGKVGLSDYIPYCTWMSAYLNAAIQIDVNSDSLP